MLSLYIHLYDDYMVADIGNDDCWIFSRYLEPDEGEYFSPSLINGSIEIWYDYEYPDGSYSCMVHFFLREDGAEWDEAHDPLPSGYDDYKAGISG